MSLDIILHDPDTQESLWEENITHNLLLLAVNYLAACRANPEAEITTSQ